MLSISCLLLLFCSLKPTIDLSIVHPAIKTYSPNLLYHSQPPLPPAHILSLNEVAESPSKLLTMCVKDKVNQTIMENSPDPTNSPMEEICENKGTINSEENLLPDFVPIIRSGAWSDIGHRNHMEDTNVCIPDLAKNFDLSLDGEIVSFYGVFDGHGGKSAAQFVCANLPRVIVEDADFPLELEKVVNRSFIQTDTQFAKMCSLHSSLSSGTTALTAMISGRSLLVANVGDCRAVLSRLGVAVEMSKDHRPCCVKETKRIESLGGYIDNGYVNGQLSVTRALGNWHLEGMKEIGHPGGLLSAEPELKMITLTKEDEFLILGSDGIWDVFTNQNAVDFTRRRLQEHNDVKLCCKELIEEALKRGTLDNLTAVMVSFHSDPPARVMAQRAKYFRSISAEGLLTLKGFIDS